MAFSYISYIKFFLRSTNQHGVHSPFVFDYLTQCLYTKPKKSRDKVTDLLMKSIPYFKAKTISIHGNEILKKQLTKDFPDAFERKPTLDILYFEKPSPKDVDGILSRFPLHNSSLIVFKNIHASKENLVFWRSLTKSQRVTVSIDMFHCGLLFIRKEQVKQHFTIRI